jgi:hypothetical protein
MYPVVIRPLALRANIHMAASMIRSEASEVLARVFPPLGEEACTVEFDQAKFARKRASDETEARMDKVWDEKLAKNPRLFNGSKFRLAGWTERDGSAGGSRLVLHVGISSYRDFQRTNCSQYVDSLLEYGEATFSDVRACLGDALAISMITVTADGYVLMMRRSHLVGEACGLVDVCGGHSEPSNVGLAPASFDGEESSDWTVAAHSRGTAPSAGASPARVALEELFGSAVDEICDEMGLLRETLSPPVLLGVTANGDTGGRMALVFHVRCSETMAGCARRYREGEAVEAYESTALLGVPVERAVEAARGTLGVVEPLGNVARVMLGRDDRWSSVPRFALKGCVELVEGKLAPTDLAASEIAPATTAALAVFCNSPVSSDE